MLCLEEVGLCNVPPDAKRCADSSKPCGVGQSCSSDDLCVDDRYSIHFVFERGLSSGGRGLARVGLVVAGIMADEVNALGVLDRPVEVEELILEVTDPVVAEQQAREVASRSPLGLRTINNSGARAAIEWFGDKEVLHIAELSNVEEFERPRSWQRYSYGVIPSPRADAATMSHFYGSWTPENDDPFGTTCERLAVVHRGDYRSSLYRSQLGRFGPSVVLDYELDGAVESARDELFEALEASGAECALLLYLSVEDDLRITSTHPAWRTARGVKRLRWVFGAEGALPELLDGLRAEGLVSELHGSVIVRYETGGAKSEEINAEYLGRYADAVADKCADFSSDDCEWFDSVRVASNYPTRIGHASDQFHLFVVAAMYAESNFGSDFSSEQLRDAFLAVTATSGDRKVCTRKNLVECRGWIDDGQPVHFFGVSSDLVFAEDGRAEGLDEVMIFSTVNEAGELSEVVRFAHEEMVAIYRAEYKGPSQ